MIKVALLDDHPLILSGIQTVLETEPDIEVVQVCSSGNQLISGFQKALPDVVLLDLQLGEEYGATILKNIKADFPAVKVIILSNLDHALLIKNLLNSGASGFILKTSALSQLPLAIRTVAQNEALYLCEEVKQLLLNASLSEKNNVINQSAFSKREQEILQLISDEYTTKQISDMLNISARTVDNYRLGLMQKLDAKNMIGMVKKAIILGLIKE